MGQGFGSTVDFLPFFDSYSANVLELDIEALGVSGVIQMADAAFGLELPVVLSAATGHAAVQVAGAIPSLSSVEVHDAITHPDEYSTDVTFDQGHAICGTAPGFGLTVDRRNWKTVAEI